MAYFVEHRRSCCLEYIWIDGNKNLRSKTKVLYNIGRESIKIDDIPEWNFDGSSTYQATGVDSEIILKPCAIFNDPFRGENGLLVLCDVYDVNNNPLESNTRYVANEIFEKKRNEQPWFGLEQEYFLFKHSKPLGFEFKDHEKQGQFYCSIGSENAYGRIIAEKHLKACLDSGINISGINAEVAPGQWEFQVGPCEGITAGDHLWIARYILERIGEEHSISIDISPKPLKGDWNGSGCHTNYSTKKMREGFNNNSGLYYINDAIEKLAHAHKDHMAVYGEGNEDRMTGKCETCNYDVFKDGISNRGHSVRRGFNTMKNSCGYFEDRRPSSNCDPYLVTSKIFKTTVLDDV